MQRVKRLLEMCRHHFPSSRPWEPHRLVLKEDKLVLMLCLGNTSQSFNLSEDDLDRDPELLVTELQRLVKRNKNLPKPPDSVA